MRAPTRLLTSVSVTVAILGSVACGDGSHSSQLTVAEFVDQADAICREYEARIDGAAPGAPTLALQVELLEALVALRRPAAPSPALQRVLAALDESANRAAAHPGQGFKGVPIDLGDIHEAGFEDCGAE